MTWGITALIAPTIKPAIAIRKMMDFSFHASVINKVICVNTAEMQPMIMPIKATSGNSDKETRLNGCTSNIGSAPKTILDTVVAVTAEMMTGVKPIIVYSITTTSMAKITPASGVLKPAAIAAATPQHTKVRVLLFGTFKYRPNALPLVAPRCTPGPSRPIDWPVINTIVAPIN